MKRRIFAFLAAALCLLTGCGPADIPQREDDGVLTIVATTYPIYLFANTLAAGVENVVVERLDTGSTSCLHDYTLTVNDMKKIERADVIAINGVGLEEFMEDALHTSDAVVIDCSEGVELLENASHHHDEHDHPHDGHDHGHFDPHYWMSATNAAIMVQNLCKGLSEIDPENEGFYQHSEHLCLGMLCRGDDGAGDGWLNIKAVEHISPEQLCSVKQMITFHDGFQYFAKAVGLELLKSIEEEAGSEASAKEIVEISELVREYDIPAIFTEKNGSDATANAIARETGVEVYSLDMIMSGDGTDVGDYIDAMKQNIQTVVEALK